MRSSRRSGRVSPKEWPRPPSRAGPSSSTSTHRAPAGRQLAGDRRAHRAASGQRSVRIRHRRRRGRFPARDTSTRSSSSSERTPISRSMRGGVRPALIWEALQWCGAERLGHSVRMAGHRRLVRAGQARAAGVVRAGPAGAAGDVPLFQPPDRGGGVHRRAPDRPMTKLRFRVTVNTDNRLMSGTTMSREMELLSEAFGYDLDDLRWFTINATRAHLPLRPSARPD